MFNENALIVSVLILVILLIIIGLNCSPKEIFTGIALVIVGSVTYLITEAAISRSGKYSKGRLLGGRFLGGCFLGGSEGPNDLCNSSCDAKALQKEYKVWLMSQELLKIVCRPGVDPKRCRVILEGWIMKMHCKNSCKCENINVCSCKNKCSPAGVLAPALRDPNSIRPSLSKVDPEITNEIVQAIMDLPTDLPLDLQSDLPIVTDSGWRYGEFTLTQTDRLCQMATMAGVEAMVACCMRYDSILAASHHWAAPAAVFNTLVQLGVRNEAFASPLNSGLLGKPGCRFFSLFKDVDAPFGSLGDLFATPLDKLLEYESDWEFNPPFVFGVMKQAASLAAKLSKKRGVYFIVRAHDPAINPVSPYSEFENVAVYSVILPPGSHSYEAATAAGPVLKPAMFPTHLMYAGPLSAEDAEVALTRIVDAWPPAPTKLELLFNAIRECKMANPSTALPSLIKSLHLDNKASRDAKWLPVRAELKRMMTELQQDKESNNSNLIEQIRIPLEEKMTVANVAELAFNINKWYTISLKERNQICPKYCELSLDTFSLFIDEESAKALSERVSAEQISAIINSKS